jgi:teichuronic acid biosynthesis glycosyltransferase TuaG
MSAPLIGKRCLDQPPVISVVIPLYNVEAWIERTLASVLAQTCDHEKVEVILVDDGSTDKSADLAAASLQGATFPFRILSTDNGGPSRARNIGWRLAHGEWIQFLDGDDLLHRDKIRIQMQAANASGIDVAVLYSDWNHLEFRNEDWQQQGLQSVDLGNDVMAGLLGSNSFIATGSQLFRRSWLLKSAGFNERVCFIEDVDLMLRIAMKGGVFRRVESTSPLFHYRRRVGSLSGSDQRQFNDGCVRNARLAEEYWRERGELTIARAKILAGAYFGAARYYATRDGARFDELVEWIESIAPGFVPDGPLHLKSACILLGYRRAEALATRYRRAKDLLRCGLWTGTSRV